MMVQALIFAISQNVDTFLLFFLWKISNVRLKKWHIVYALAAIPGSAFVAALFGKLIQSHFQSNLLNLISAGILFIIGVMSIRDAIAEKQSATDTPFLTISSSVLNSLLPSAVFGSINLHPWYLLLSSFLVVSVEIAVCRYPFHFAEKTQNKLTAISGIAMILIGVWNLLV